MILIKLGGSIITDKSRECTIRQDVLHSVVRDIASCYNRGEQIILIHGAGSFGHIKAKKWDIKNGMVEGESRDEKLLGASMVQADVRRLNLYVLDALAKAGVPAISIPPSAVGRMSEGALSKLDTGIFADALESGFVPVSFGDVVLDSEKVFSISSGDEIMYRVACDIGVEKAYFVCDVDGLYDSDPKNNPEAMLFPRVKAGEVGYIMASSSGTACSGGCHGCASTNRDVTGAMRGKVAWAVKMAYKCIPVHFVNGMVDGRLGEALEGKVTTQTILEA